MSDPELIEIDCLIPSHETRRLDLFLAEELDLPRAIVTKAITEAEILVNDNPVKKSYRLRGNESVTGKIALPGQLQAIPKEAELPVVYQDENLAVVNKPVGMAAHPAKGWEGPTVLEALLAQGMTINTPGDQWRRGIVHRLDAATTGLLVVAKTPQAYESLQADFAARRVHKIYHALIQGHLPQAAGTIIAPIGRSQSKDYKMAVRPDGREAITHYQEIQKFPQTTLLEIGLETGRTHQIRVHLASLGHPCVGDSTYGANPKLSAALGLDRQWLHASKLSFKHPVTGENCSFSADFAPDLEAALALAAK
ncbi:hypothetical protein BK816_05620 [Boudabousia tangfeifanii]|uniref:Pseudouridine synthase n=1 Tax=Boudabousia tangfeifanii TaxID=1912795 RepID=A0A1D9MKS9_9ACTO|nr:RluA family pseudouridine synthase [Boudabousia tangfeifanii]AOZ72838.1 hypothetical protein BK816_05620 [Boudabousia tangfeifanii]